MKCIWSMRLVALFLVSAVLIGCRKPAPFHPAPASYLPNPAYAPQNASSYGSPAATQQPTGSGSRSAPLSSGSRSAPSYQGSGSR